MAEHWHKVGSVCAAVSGQGCGLGMVLEAAEVKPLKVQAPRVLLVREVLLLVKRREPRAGINVWL